MKTRLTALVISAAQILACRGEGLCSKEPAALRAASDLLSKLRMSSEYVASRAYGQDSGDKWNIWIPHATAGGVLWLPANGLIEVGKADCTSRWVPQR